MWLLQKQHLYCSGAMSKSSKFPRKCFCPSIKILAKLFEGLAVFSIHKRALSTF